MNAFPVEARANIEQIGAELAPKFSGIFSPQTVERLVADVNADLARQARITSFLPALTKRFARDRLDAIAFAKPDIAHPVHVLFICERNAGRSRIAAALLKSISQGKVLVTSAESRPENDLQPLVAEAMLEVGVAISAEQSKGITEDVVSSADVVVTMGGGEVCPVLSGKRYIDWDLPPADPDSLEAVRQLRSEIASRVEALFEEINSETRTR